MKNKKVLLTIKKICGDTNSHFRKTNAGTVSWINVPTNCANEARWINDSTYDIDYNFCTALEKVLLIEKKFFAD